jgi:tRNA threonylcarbamoyl adenosine modification protein (Sua5/YciO/YrdC/YwlC family)
MNPSKRQIMALDYLRDGVIAHPTDTVYGLACLANNPGAIKTLIDLKQRDLDKGFILLASNVEYILPYIDANLDIKLINKLAKQSVIPTTYLVPKSETTSNFISGTSEFVAVRITSDPLVRFFCENTGSALISTSANPQGQKVASSMLELNTYFKQSLSFTLPPKKYDSEPSIIINFITGEQIR